MFEQSFILNGHRPTPVLSARIPAGYKRNNNLWYFYCKAPQDWFALSKYRWLTTDQFLSRSHRNANV